MASLCGGLETSATGGGDDFVDSVIEKHAAGGAFGTDAGGCSDDFAGGGFDFRCGGGGAEREPKAGFGVGCGDSHGSEDVRWCGVAGFAGGTG